MDKFLILFAGFSITNILVFQHVFHWMRRLLSGLGDRAFELKVRNNALCGFRHAYVGRFVRCHACMGFWVGVFLYAVLGKPIVEDMALSFTVNAIFAGAIQSGFNLVAWLILRQLGAEEL